MPDARDFQLLTEIQSGLPLSPRPYHDIGLTLGMSEAEVIERLALLKRAGLIKRLGVIVKHRQLGYRANAMIVWNIPDAEVKLLGDRVSRCSFVTLCYRRPRTPEWPYNLYCMIHGKNRGTVLAQLEQLSADCGLHAFDREILFSRRCFKQRGALYRPVTHTAVNEPAHG
ncbi:MAG: siroheme decarboxylase subunit beta [Gammaproteobacteria bacterium]